MRLFQIVLIGGFVLALQFPCDAQVDSNWNGGNGVWSDAANWSTDEFPNNGNGGFNYNAIIGSGTVDLDLNVALDGLNLGLATISNGGFSLDIANYLFWSAGAFGGAGTTHIDGVSTITFSNTKLVDVGHELNFNGGGTWDNGDVVVNGTLNNNASSELTASASRDLEGSGLVNNLGTFRKVNPSTTTDFFVPFDNSGLISIDEGAIRVVVGGLTNTGQVDVASGATLVLNSGISTFDPGTTITGTGTVDVGSDTIFNEALIDFGGMTSFTGGVTNINSDYTTDGLGLLSTSATVNVNSSVLTANGDFIWSAGAFGGAGTTHVDGITTITFSNTKLVDVDHELNFNGGGTWDNGDVVVNGTLNNNASSELTASASRDLEGSGLVNNLGTFRKVNPSTTTDFFVPFDNSGLISIDEGAIRVVVGGLTNTGQVDVASGATLVLNSGISTFESGSTLTGEGTLNSSGGTSTFLGGEISPGNSIGTLTVTGNSALNLVGGASIAIEMDSANGIAGTNWDFIEASTATFDFNDDLSPLGVFVKLRSLDQNGNPGVVFDFDDTQDYSWPIANVGTIDDFSSNFIVVDTSEFEGDYCGIFTVVAEDGQLKINYTSSVVTTSPDGLTTIRGNLIDGDLFSTIESDDKYIQYNPGFTLSSNEPPVWVEFTGQIPNATPQWLNIKVESNANTPGIIQTVEVFNWVSDEYDLVATRPTSFIADGITNVAIPLPMEYVQPDTESVKARLGWKADGFILLYPWEVQIDYVAWLLQ